MPNADIYDLLETKTLLYGEQFKGLLASIGSGTISSSLNYILTTAFKMNIHTSTFISMYLIGNLLTYCFDILFAKEHFYDSVLKKNIAYEFGAFSKKFSWLIKSFSDKYFLRFFVTVMIDSIIGLAILKWVIRTLDDNFILTNKKYIKYRNIVVAILVSVFTFILYLNALRFNWAYSNDNNPIMNLLILIWFTMSLLIVVKFDDLTKGVIDVNSIPFRNKKNFDI
jgi:hypothetical protein